jgi:photosystem II stability/assembly factor-like uncharacterized protein
MRIPPFTRLLLTALGLVLSLAASASAQVPWARQSPLPGTPVGQAAFSGTRGYLVGSGQQPFETTDGGFTWHERALGNGGFLAVTFFDALHGWMVGNHSSLGLGAYRTVDGGATWSVMNNVPFGSYGHVQFVSATHGWMGANTVLAETFDAGDTWSLVNLPTTTFQGRFAFRDAQVGLCSGGGTLFRTTDGGANWTQVGSYLADSIQFLDANTVLISIPPQFSPPDFARSTDGGQTWQTIDVPNVALENPVRVTATTLIANAGGFARNDLYRSTDGGLSWSQVLHGTWWPFEGGQFIDASNGIELGYGGQIFRTQDAGVHWQQVSSGMTSAQLEDIDMLDGAHGVAVGSDGTVFVTSDGGAQWRADRPGFEFSHGDTLLAVSTVQPSFVFAAGLYGTLVKSFDSGATWQGVPGPGGGTGDYWATKFVTQDEGWIAGAFQAIYHTTDGGQNWTKQYGGVQFGSSEAVYRLDFTDALHGWAVGTFNGVLITTDGGTTWTQHSFGSSFPFCREIDMVDVQTGWCASRQNFVARTTDGGNSWTQQPIPADPANPEQFVFALSAVSTTECWAATTQGRVYHTTNAGSTWAFVDTGFHGAYDSWYGMRALASGDVWLAGGGGGVVRRLASQVDAGVAFCAGDGSGAACPCGNGGAPGSGCASSVNVSGAHLGAVGQPAVTADTLVLRGSGMPNSSCLYFQGTTQANAGLGVVFGDGLRCASGTVLRLGTQLNVSGNSQYPGLGDPAISLRGLVTTPSVRAYQVWYRNAASFCTPSTFNLTNGLNVTWIL